MVRCSLLIMLLSIVGAAGIAADGSTIGVAAEVARKSPPSPMIEIRPTAPGPDHAWVPGRWQWSGERYTWVDGQWKKRPHDLAVWRAGSWQRQGAGWVWRHGLWTRQRGTGRTSAAAGITSRHDRFEAEGKR